MLKQRIKGAALQSLAMIIITIDCLTCVHSNVGMKRQQPSMLPNCQKGNIVPKVCHMLLHTDCLAFSCCGS